MGVHSGDRFSLTYFCYTFSYLFCSRQPVTSLFSVLFAVFLITGCSATWSGVKQDTSDAWDWSKAKVHQGADYVKEKTE